MSRRWKSSKPTFSKWISASSCLPGETADVVGNLPYYITSPILLRLFAAGVNGLLARAVVMMQREVAGRVSAAPGCREYGLLSATTQMNARVETLFTLPPTAFSPPPDVYSTVLRLEFAPRFVELGVDAAGFDAFLRRCFAQKRKTLANNLRAAGHAGARGYSADELRAAWPAAIPPLARAESLALEPLAALYRALARFARRRISSAQHIAAAPCPPSAPPREPAGAARAPAFALAASGPRPAQSNAGLARWFATRWRAPRRPHG